MWTSPFGGRAAAAREGPDDDSHHRGPRGPPLAKRIELLLHVEEPNAAGCPGREPLAGRVEHQLRDNPLRAEEYPRRIVRREVVQVNPRLREVERVRVTGPFPSGRVPCANQGEALAVRREDKPLERVARVLPPERTLLPRRGVDQPGLAGKRPVCQHLAVR